MYSHFGPWFVPFNSHRITGTSFGYNIMKKTKTCPYLMFLFEVQIVFPMNISKIVGSVIVNIGYIRSKFLNLVISPTSRTSYKVINVCCLRNFMPIFLLIIGISFQHVFEGLSYILFLVCCVVLWRWCAWVSVADAAGKRPTVYSLCTK